MSNFDNQNSDDKLANNTPEKRLGNQLRLARAELRISQQHLADLLNSKEPVFTFSQTKISHGERTGKVMATEFMAWVRVLIKLYSDKGVTGKTIKDFEV